MDMAGLTNLTNSIISRDTEIWVTIKGFEDYEISNWGHVWSKTKQRELATNPTGLNGCVPVCLYKDGQPTMCLVHRLVADHFLINPDPEHLTHVLHKDEDNSNNRVDNLYFGSAKQSTGQAKVKESCRNTNLARRGNYIIGIRGEEKVKARSLREASEKTGVSKSTVSYALEHDTRPKGWCFHLEPQTK